MNENKTAMQQKTESLLEESPLYDMIIVGGGPAGYTAALYGARAGLDTVVLEKMGAGGQMTQAEQIDNYPGFEEGISGFLLGDQMRRGAERFGAVTRLAEVISLELSGKIKKARTSAGTLYGKTLVVATGASPRELGLPLEKELIGKGVHYCAACDGMFYRGKTVVVVGGGNSAVEDALILSRFCKEVILVHRRDTLRAERIYQDQLMKKTNVTFFWNCTLKALLTDQRLTGIRLENTKTQAEQVLSCEGVFVSIGRIPATALVSGLLPLDAGGYIIADESTRTALPGVFAVGDVRAKSVRQIVTAVADGAVCAHYAEEYLAGVTF